MRKYPNSIYTSGHEYYPPKHTNVEDGETVWRPSKCPCVCQQKYHGGAYVEFTTDLVTTPPVSGNCVTYAEPASAVSIANSMGDGLCQGYHYGSGATCHWSWDSTFDTMPSVTITQMNLMDDGSAYFIVFKPVLFPAVYCWVGFCSEFDCLGNNVFEWIAGRSTAPASCNVAWVEGGP